MNSKSMQRRVIAVTQTAMDEVLKHPGNSIMWYKHLTGIDTMEAQIQLAYENGLLIRVADTTKPGGYAYYPTRIPTIGDR